MNFMNLKLGNDSNTHARTKHAHTQTDTHMHKHTYTNTHTQTQNICDDPSHFMGGSCELGMRQAEVW